MRIHLLNHVEHFGTPWINLQGFNIRNFDRVESLLNILEQKKDIDFVLLNMLLFEKYLNSKKYFEDEIKVDEVIDIDGHFEYVGENTLCDEIMAYSIFLQFPTMKALSKTLLPFSGRICFERLNAQHGWG